MASECFGVFFVQLKVHISFFWLVNLLFKKVAKYKCSLYYHFMLCKNCIQYFWNAKNLMQRLQSCRNKINAAFRLDMLIIRDILTDFFIATWLKLVIMAYSTFCWTLVTCMHAKIYSLIEIKLVEVISFFPDFYSGCR